MKIFSRNPIPMSFLMNNISFHIIFQTEQFAGKTECLMRFLKHLLTLRMARFPDMDNSTKRQKIN